MPLFREKSKRDAQRSAELEIAAAPVLENLAIIEPTTPSNKDARPLEEYEKTERRSSNGLGIYGNALDDKGCSEDDVVIRSGADASKYLLSLRDDGDPVLTFRSAVLGTAFACFQAAMNQIYNVSTTPIHVRVDVDS
jgi:hypothetical protein